MSIRIEKHVDVPRSMGDVTTEPTGFPNRTDTTMAFSDATRTFLIFAPSGSFEFYSLGKRYKKTSAQTVIITDTEGLWFFYFTSAGVLVASQTPWGFGNGQVFTAIGYWDATNKSLIGFGDERHGIIMDSATHERLHNITGTVWQTGHTPDVTLGSGSLDADAEIQSISSGIIRDEDIKHEASTQTTYEIWYKSGASTDWRKESSSPSLVAVTTSRPDWNEFVGGAWQRTETTNNKFILMHQFATNSLDKPNILIMGEAQYNSRSDAQEGALSEITTLTTGSLPTVEFSAIATFIIQCADSYSNSYNARIIATGEGGDFIDFRGNDKIGGSGVTSNHGNLSGLDNDDHTQYILTNGGRAFTGQPTIAYNIAAETKKWSFVIPDPNTLYDIDTQVPFYTTSGALKVTRVKIDLSTTGQNVAGDLKYADNVSSFTNATVIRAFDTSSGVLDATSLSLSVPSGKEVYLDFDSQPNAAILFMKVYVEWDYD